ncbi:MAG: four-carbon acid sugar kinase family protein, partial [Deltaproteobacteria bacterium]
VRNTQSRTLPPPEAAGRVGGALADLRAGWSGIVLKKIDTGLRGPLGAEIDAAMDVLGVGEAFVLPAIPEVGRTTEQGRQMIGGVPVHRTAFARDPQNPIRDASVAAAVEASGRRRAGVIGLGAIRGRDDFDNAVEEARAAGTAVIVCDAETDADLERAVRRLLSRPRPLLLVGSTGLARALRRVLGPENGGRARGGTSFSAGRGVLVVAGSAHPATRAQVECAAARRLIEPLVVDDPGAAAPAAPACWRRSAQAHSPRWRGRGRAAWCSSAARPPTTSSTGSVTRCSPSSHASVRWSCARGS